ncbi:MAG TPA: ATP-grasp domain-containing protein [Actinomycetota bacterium]|nr:ATP-grasp domain-containing protein [Actinomycetota bacterium]
MDVLFVEVHLSPAGPDVPSPGSEGLRLSRELGYRNVVLSANPANYPARVHELVDEWRRCDTHSAAAMAAAADGTDARGLLTFSDLFTGRATSEAGRLLGLRAATPDAPALARDKSAVRRALDGAGIPNPKWAVVPADERAPTSPIGFPCVVKPVDGLASWDVVRVADDRELEEAVRAHRERALYGGRVEPKHVLLLEEELRGPLTSAEGFVDGDEVEIWGYSDRVLAGYPYFVEVRSTFSADRPCAAADDFVRLVTKAAGYDFGAFHLELITTGDGPRLVELNPRLIGGRAHLCLDHASGSDSIAYVLGRYLGESTVAPPRARRASTMRDLWVEEDGVVEAIVGAEEAAAVPGVEDLQLWVEPGAEVARPTSDGDLIGHVITSGESGRESAAVAERAAALIRVETVPRTRAS